MPVELLEGGLVPTLDSDAEITDYEDVMIDGQPGDDWDTALRRTKAKMSKKRKLSDETDNTADGTATDSARPGSKKAKQLAGSKKAKKSVKADDDESDGNGDGEFASDFEFDVESDYDEPGVSQPFYWGNQALAASTLVPAKGVDVGDIISRHRQAAEVDDAGSDAESNAESESGFEEEEEIESGDDNDEGEEDDDEKESDDESGVESEPAQPTELHLNSDSDSDSDEEDEDEEEAARREAFFAPEPADEPVKRKSGSKKSSSFGADYDRSFVALGVSLPIRLGLDDMKMFHATPIQQKALPIGIAGKDIVGGAVTGSGKTAAFLLPILERLLRRPRHLQLTRVVILLPTRELAVQCHTAAIKLAGHTDISAALAVGGSSVRAQEAELRRKPDIVIATPGRFIDHVRNSAGFDTDGVEILVLDEADRMLQDGFADELDEIFKSLPKNRQTMLFSATMTQSVDKLIRAGLDKPVRIIVDDSASTVSTMRQEFVRLRPGKEHYRLPYLLYLCTAIHKSRVIVFFQRKQEAHRVRVLFGLVGLKVAELHGDLTQEQRLQSIELFRSHQVDFLLASDVAARGIDIPAVKAVINYEAPPSYDTYLHRIGRTARAGRTGTSCTIAAEKDRAIVKAAKKGGSSSKSSSTSASSVLVSRTIPNEDADSWVLKIGNLESDIVQVLSEEKEQKALGQAERDIRRGENLVEHQADIMARPRRTWFQSEDAKADAKDRASKIEPGGIKSARNGAGVSTVAVSGISSKLSNKQMKKMDSARERKESGGQTCKGKSRAVRATGASRGAGHQKSAGKAKKGGKKGGKRK